MSWLAGGIGNLASQINTDGSQHYTQKIDFKWLKNRNVKGNAMKLMKMKTFDFVTEKNFLTSKAPAIGQISPKVGGCDYNKFRIFVQPRTSWTKLTGDKVGDTY